MRIAAPANRKMDRNIPGVIRKKEVGNNSASTRDLVTAAKAINGAVAMRNLLSILTFLLERSLSDAIIPTPSSRPYAMVLTVLYPDC